MKDTPADLHPFSLPGSYLVLELANGCNLKCRHCAQSEPAHPHTAQTGHFPVEGVERLMADLARHQVRFETLILFWLGESLLHPEFATVYERVLPYCGAGRVFGQVELHTNATLLTRRVAARVLNRLSAPQRWHLTLDAATPETYRAVKGADLLPRAEENARRLLSWKGRGGFRRPQLVLQYIVSDRNAHEVDAFIAKWRSAFDEARLPLALTAFHVPNEPEGNYLFFKSLDCPTAAEQVLQNAVFRTVVERLGLAPPLDPLAAQKVDAPVQTFQAELSTPCSGFWKSPVIGWDGMLTTCTRDNLGENRLGNVLETPFTTLWYGPGRLKRWREQVARGHYEGLPLCQTCFIPRSVNYTGITVDELTAVGAL